MSISAFDSWLAFTIGFGVPGYGEEGQESDDPSDPGGFTWRGITLSTYRDFIRDDGFTSTQLLQLTEDQIVAFYGACFWNPVAGNQLPPALALGVADFAVNAGVWQAAVTLQQAVGAGQDGSIGPDTIKAVEAENLTFLVGRYTQLRLAFYQSLTGEAEFLSGWTARTNACDTAMAALLPSAPASVPYFNAVLLALPSRGRGARRPQLIHQGASA